MCVIMLKIQLSRACTMDLKSLITRLEHDSAFAIEWFESNYIKLNWAKCHFLISGRKYDALFANVGEAKIWESSQPKPLGILIDRDLKVDEYVLSQSWKILLNFSLAIAHLFKCFVGDKLMQEKIIKSSLRAVYSDEISPLESWQKVSQKLCIKETLRH